jgi:glycosyltransferase involved in cell wall biosynthesis
MKDKKIALFMIAPLTHGGGAEKYFMNLAKNLSTGENFAANVVTFNDKSFRRFARLLHIFTRGNFFWKIDDYEKGMREKREDIEKELGRARWIESPRKKLGKILGSYDIVYAKNEIADLLLLKMIGYKKLPPVVVGVHTPLFYPSAKSFFSKLHNVLYSSFFFKWLLSGTAFVHVSNKSAKDIVENKLKAKSRLIYYPFSASQINNSARGNQCGIEFDAKKTNIIFVGRMAEQKGIDVLIRMIEKIGQDESAAEKIHVNIFGSGDKKHEDAIKSKAGEYSFVRYFGHIENKYIPDILAKQDIMVFPSRWETLPYSILEAQAMGVPVIAFDIPGPSDIIEKEKTGFLVESEEEFFEKIKSVVEGKTFFDKGAIIQSVENKFNPEKIYSEIIHMFQDNL